MIKKSLPKALLLPLTKYPKIRQRSPLAETRAPWLWQMNENYFNKNYNLSFLNNLNHFTLSFKVKELIYGYTIK